MCVCVFDCLSYLCSATLCNHNSHHPPFSALLLQCASHLNLGWKITVEEPPDVDINNNIIITDNTALSVGASFTLLLITLILLYILH